MIKNFTVKSIGYAFLVSVGVLLSGCNTTDVANMLSSFNGAQAGSYVRPKPPSAIVVCRSHQCAPARQNMSREFLFNKVLNIFDNNEGLPVQICTADEASKSCIENYIKYPAVVGVTPANVYIDSARIMELSMRKQTQTLELVLDYNVSYNGIKAICSSSKSILFARSADYMLLEDAGYECKMTTNGTSIATTVFAIDYIDLDFGIIGGQYSIGLAGPASGGSSGYMLMRFAKNGFPLEPRFVVKEQVTAPISEQSVNTRIEAGPRKQDRDYSVGPIPKDRL